MCDFNIIAPKINCKSNSRNLEGIFVLKDCIRDTSSHLKSLSLFIIIKNNVTFEYQLILNRAGLPGVENWYSLKICAHHRNELGIFYKGKQKCESLDHPNVFKQKFRSINLSKANFILNKQSVPRAGDAICRECYKNINDKFNNSNQKENNIVLNNIKLDTQPSKLKLPLLLLSKLLLILLFQLALVETENTDTRRAAKRIADIKIENIKTEQKDYDDLGDNDKIELLNGFASDLRSMIEYKFPYECSIILNNFMNITLFLK